VPSRARLTFEQHLLRDVHRLMDAHRAQQGGRGRPLSVYTRSGVFLLSAAWELYIEEVAAECLEWLLYEATLPTDLPDLLQGTLAASVRRAGEMAALGLAGDGWKDMLRDIVRSRVAALNTPDVPRVSSLLRDCAGIDLVGTLGPHTNRVTEFVRKRGNIAHQGVRAGHVGIAELDDDYAFICSLVTEIDNALIAPLRERLGYRPWNRRA
jgi:hypothetical protein